MQFLKERILNAAQLKRLSEHKYSCTSASLLDAWLQPWWCWLSLDAIDGKQARRTGSQSPLGELFDHGCDSISTVFIALGACIAVKLGEYPTWMFFQ
ncbi:Choline/ethanolaminephosphotransferase 1, partial [Operophtera brumata]